MARIVRERSFYKNLLMLTLPIALQNIITYLVTLADNIMVGSLGETTLSGVYMANQVMSFIQMLVIGLSTSCTVLATQYWGKRDTKSVCSIAAITLRFAIVIALAAWAVVFFFPGRVVSLFTNEPAVIKEGVVYIRIICFTYIFFVLTNVLIAVMRSVENVRIGMIVSLSTLVVNVSLNWLLIFGHWGFPRLGIRGAAIATLTARIIETLIMIVYVRKIDKKLRFRFRELLSTNRLLRKDYIKYGLPVIAGDVIWGLNTATQGAIIGRLGETAMASVSIAGTIFQIAAVAVYGLAGASAIVIGKTVGSGDYERVKDYSKTLQFVFLGLGLISGGVLYATRGLWLSIYGDMTPETIKMANQLLTVLAVTLVGTAYQMSSLTGIVRAGGATHFVFVNDTIFVWGVVIPSALIAAFVFHAEPWVVYACLKCDQILKCFVAVVKVNRYKWIKQLTREQSEVA